MEKLYDKLILFLCSVVFLISNELPIEIILPMILVICFNCFVSFFDKIALNIITYVAYVSLCIYSPDFIYFLPFMCYDLSGTVYRYILFLGIFAMIYSMNAFSLTTLFTLLLLAVLSYLLRKRTLALLQAKQDYLKMRDEMIAKAEMLSLKNKDLLEKQDYEISNATLNERNRIAREIHDTVGHLLSSSILQIGAMLAVCKDETMKQSLTNIKDTLSSGMDSIRSSIHNIYEDSMDLQTKLQELVHNFTFCPATLSYDINHDFTMKAKYSILFIVKEALSNVMKHSNATLVEIIIKEVSETYQITISDNGTKKSLTDCSGMGVSNMYERVNSLGGNFYIDTKNGYRIVISLPKQK